MDNMRLVKGVELFSTWTPFEPLVDGLTELNAELAKSRNPNGGEGEPLVGRIGGIVSTQATDQQGERLIQDGIDWSYFLTKGWFNYEHKAGPDNVMGEPTAVRATTFEGQPAHEVEGVLYLHNEAARKAYSNACAMKKAKSSRRLGYSVEGQVLARDSRRPKDIIKSRVLNIAITAHPVHPDARLEVLARSLTSAGYQNPSYGGGTLAPLVTQSLEGVPSLATFGVDKMKGGRMTIEQLAMHITTQFPSVSYGEAVNIATRIAQSVRH